MDSKAQLNIMKLVNTLVMTVEDQRERVRLRRRFEADDIREVFKEVKDHAQFEAKSSATLEVGMDCCKDGAGAVVLKQFDCSILEYLFFEMLVR